jgi:hypothetical protein
VLSIVNLGKTNATLTIELKGATVGTACWNLFTGNQVSATPVLKPLEVYFVEVTDGSTGIITDYQSGTIGIDDNSTDKNTIYRYYPHKSIDTRKEGKKKYSTPDYKSEDNSPTIDSYTRFIYETSSSEKRAKKKFDSGEKDADADNTGVEPVQYASADPEYSKELSTDLSTINQVKQEGATVLFESDVLDKSLLESNIVNKAPSLNIRIKKETQKRQPTILSDSKKQKRSPIAGIVAATLLASFGALVMIKDQ